MGFAAAVFLNSPAFAGDPVPGIDVSLEQIPGGLVKTVTTDKGGIAIFAAVAPGRYRIIVRTVPAKSGRGLNSSKSNVKLTVGATTPQDVEADLSAGKTYTREVMVPRGAPQSVAIALSMDKASVGIKEEGVK